MTVETVSAPAPTNPARRLPLVAVIGHPNAGKTSLFNALSGARQKVGNYPGVTVERKSADLSLPSGTRVELLDLPGCYSLVPHSLDESVTRDTLLGLQPGESRPDAILLVTDATNLAAHLRFALDAKRLGIPMVMALNRMDMAARDGLSLDSALLSEKLGIPVIGTVAVRKRGLPELLAAVERALPAAGAVPGSHPEFKPADPRILGREARAIAKSVTLTEGQSRATSRKLDAVLLHPVAGPIILALLLFLMFQAVFSWAEAPMGWIEGGIAWAQGIVSSVLPDSVFRSFLNDGLLAGVGSVIVFLPQIIILFAFILVLEGSGYMVRAAFLMDRLMASVGLNGAAFVPLLSSFACAIPGIMATRSIPDARDRLTTILIAPLMTCSARLPVYAVIIAAFIPAQSVWGPIGLQGMVLFILYLTGILGAMAAAFVLKRTVTKGPPPSFMMEMPSYQLPVLRDVLVGLWLRAGAFLKRAGTIIMGVTVALWALASFPAVPEGSPQTQVEYSIAGRIGNAIEPLVRPIGFNHEIAMSLLPAMAAREVAVAALATIYALDADDEDTSGLIERLQGSWPLPTALAFLAWFVFAPQCLSTLAVVRRETAGWKWPLFMFGYLTALAYIAAGITYHVAVAMGLG